MARLARCHSISSRGGGPSMGGPPVPSGSSTATKLTSAPGSPFTLSSARSRSSHGRCVDLAHLRSEDVMLDVGCGNGAYLAELRRRGHHGLVLGVTPSVGMLLADQQEPPRPPWWRSRRRSRPAPGRRFRLGGDRPHMLYHVPEPAAAISEFRRCLDPAAVCSSARNVDDHLYELRPSCTRGPPSLWPVEACLRGADGARKGEGNPGGGVRLCGAP